MAKSKNKLSRQLSTKKIKVLVYADSPTCATGFGTVTRNICEALYKTGRYEIDILGINFWGDPHSFPYRIWPTGINGDRDPYGRKKVASMIPQMKYDILFLLQDTFILDFMPALFTKLRTDGKVFKSICYFPIDGVPKTQWIANVNNADEVVAYSQFGADAAKVALPDCKDLHIIPHGANVNDFKPLPLGEIKAFRKQYFGKHSDKFIITNLNRNQHRKDIPRTIAAFKKFRESVPESVLYLHMAPKDQGWNLPEVCKSYGFNLAEDVIFPENFGPNQGYPREVVNMIYNAADLVVSTTLGEGYGLSWVESMAAKTSVLMPNNTAITENITEDRGYLCDSGTSIALTTVLANDNEVIRPLVDVEDMAKKMVHIYNNPEEAKEKVDKAYKWVHESLNWQGNVGKQWVKLFDKVYADLIEGKIANTNSGSKVIKTESF
jgi:glycosyltransferase involved in cell wall biosynthesis